MAETKTKGPDRLEQAWKLAVGLPDDRKSQVADYIEFLAWCDEDDDVWEPDEEEEEAVRAWLAGEGEPGIPLEEVMRESEELGDNVLS